MMFSILWELIRMSKIEKLKNLAQNTDSAGEREAALAGVSRLEEIERTKPKKTFVFRKSPDAKTVKSVITDEVEVAIKIKIIGGVIKGYFPDLLPKEMEDIERLIYYKTMGKF